MKLFNTCSSYFTLSRHMNADILMSDGGFAATIFPVISGYNLEDARDCPEIRSPEP